ncbi:MAG: hypoxanthine phosphoribosyltransferase [Bacillota bacterium]|nr:hypoxanthine phosphoribosyltransferase [Bacillota bacterium]
MHRNVKETISAIEIDRIVSELAERISEDYRDKNPIVVGILKGANVFVADLIRKLDFFLEVDYMVVSSYGLSTTSSGAVQILKDLSSDVNQRDIIVVEDLIDTGLTLSYLKDNLLARKPNSLKICTLLNKPSRRKVEIDIDYVGRDIEDYFVVGYGIDYAEKYRNLPYIGMVREEK